MDIRKREALTMSPGFMDIATTTPGIGALMIFVVSFVTFCCMYLLSSVASLVNTRNLYLEKKEEMRKNCYKSKLYQSSIDYFFKKNIISKILNKYVMLIS